MKRKPKDNNKPGGKVWIDRAMFSHKVVGAHLQPPKGAGPRGYGPFAAWQWMIAHARYVSNGIERGQFQHSIAFMAKEWDWPERSVKSFIKKLVSARMLERVPQRGRQTVVTSIVNYGKYQAPSKKKPPKESPKESEGVHNYNKDSNKDNKKENIPPPAEPDADPIPDPDPESDPKPRGLPEAPAEQVDEAFVIIQNFIKHRDVAMPVPKKLTDRQRKLLGKTLLEIDGIKGLRQALTNGWQSSIIMGTNKRFSKRPTLGWMLGGSKFAAIGDGLIDLYEGKYEPDIKRNVADPDSKAREAKRAKIRAEDERIRNESEWFRVLWAEKEREIKRAGKKIYKSDMDAVSKIAYEKSFQGWPGL
jgi:hypothetical protein